LDRHDYLQLIPLLEAAIKAKKKEAKTESPFRKLLIGEISKRHGCSISDAEGGTDTLILWWKLKNKTHRALTSDDGRAIRMIVKEFGRRRRIQDNTEHDSKIISPICEANDNEVIFIGHRPDRKLAVLVRANEENIFVHEQTWSYNCTTGALAMTKQREWTIVDHRHESWKCLYASDAWEDWNKHARWNKILRDDERRVLIDEAIADRIQWVIKTNKEKSHVDFFGNTVVKHHFTPLVATMTADGPIRVYYIGRKSSYNRQRLLSHDIESPRICNNKIIWKRNNDGVTYESFHIDLSGYQSGKPWEKRDEHIVWKNEKALGQLDRQYQTIIELKKKHKELRRLTQSIVNILEERAEDQFNKDEFNKFIEENDPDLWEDHKKNVKFKFNEYRLMDIIQLMVERGEELYGWSMDRVLKHLATNKTATKKTKVDYFSDETSNLIEDAENEIAMIKDMNLRMPSKSDVAAYMKKVYKSDDDDDLTPVV